MNFGEKLYKLRKSQGMTQEALSEKLNTSRQAISKWENNQGFPETEKLLALASIFDVTVDYLLKEDVDESNQFEEGYYVSKEEAENYLVRSSRRAKYLALGFFFLILIGMPYNLINEMSLRIVGIAIFLILAIICFFWEETKSISVDRIISKEPLVFDETTLKSLQTIYQNKKRKLDTLMLIGFVLIVIGVIPIFVVTKGYLTLDFSHLYFAGFFLVIAVGVLIFGYSLELSEAYQLLANNKEHTNTFLFRIKRKVKKLLD